MHLDRDRARPTVLHGTFHAYELAALTAAARYVAETAPADVPSESVDQLRSLLADYDDQVHRLATARTRRGEGQSDAA